MGGAADDARGARGIVATTQSERASAEVLHAAAQREAASAAMEVSASVFNRPGQHDSVRSSSAYQRWQACRERARQLGHLLEARG